jgi:hypothetical protein
MFCMDNSVNYCISIRTIIESIYIHSAKNGRFHKNKNANYALLYTNDDEKLSKTSNEADQMKVYDSIIVKNPTSSHDL